MLKKRVVALVLTLSMALTMLAGCGQQTAKESSESQKSSVVESTSKEESAVSSVSKEEVVELEEKTIQIWLPGPGKQKDSDEVWEAFNQKLQEYVPNTTVEFSVFANADYKEKYSQMLASGEKVDLAWNASWVTGRSQAKDFRDGNTIALDELLEEYGQGIIETLGWDTIDSHRTDGKISHLAGSLYRGTHLSYAC